MDALGIKGIAPNEIIESLQQRGIKSFTPPQEAAIKSGLLSGNSMVVAAPTASGKTLIAELAAVNSIIGKGMKAVYIAPLRALVSEKYEEFKSAYPYIKSAISIGDLDSNDQWLANFELIFVSTEKFDSLIRHGVDWLPRIGCIVFDEVHMIGDLSRGPTLELLMTKLSQTTSAQIVALSATIGNAKEIAKWLNAKLVESDYRPVKLKRGVLYDNTIYYHDPEEDRVEEVGIDAPSKIPEIKIVEDTLSRNKQIIIFYSTKKNAEAGAVRLASHVAKTLKPSDKEDLDAIGDKVLNALERPTLQCVKLAGLIKSGIAFHHSGLLNDQKNRVEGAFKNNSIKVVCSTTTLAMGLNMPANTVLVRDVSRFSENFGSEKLSVNEMLQLFGRAGRPQYDTEGRALLIAKSKENAEELYHRYITAKPEAVDSGLGRAPELRTHLLAFISEEFLNSAESIHSFMMKTFYGFQYGNSRHMRNVVSEVLRDLERWEFVANDGDSYRATKLGKRVSELYIDPLSARWIANCIESKRDVISNLYMVCNTLEMRPYIKMTEEAESTYVFYKHMNQKMFEGYESMEEGLYNPVGAFSTALMLHDWMEEKREDEIIKKYSTTPGAIYAKLTRADWITYAAIEMSKILRQPSRDIVDVRVRMRYGIKEELLDLVRLEQIGRVRARALYNNGIKTVAELRDSRERANRILGKEITDRVFKQFDE